MVGVFDPQVGDHGAVEGDEIRRRPIHQFRHGAIVVPPPRTQIRVDDPRHTIPAAAGAGRKQRADANHRERPDQPANTLHRRLLL